jgi:putative efflux protein, MATE family
MQSAILHQNRKTLALASPIIAGQVGQMLMGWADTLMVGRVGVVPLAACAFANTLLAVVFVFGFGVMSSVTVRASQAFGAGRGTEVVHRAGILLGAGLGAVLLCILLALLPVLHWFGQPPDVNAAAPGYLVLTAMSLVPAMMLTAEKGFAESLSRPWLPFWIVLGGVLLNVLLNWIFIFGKLGAPALGLTGAGLATFLARCVAVAALMLCMRRSSYFRKFLVRADDGRTIGSELRALLRIGLPAGGQLLAEVTAFASASIMMGWIGVNALAAHQIAITCAATTFMVPLGLGMAVTVRVGQTLGAGALNDVRPIAFGGLGMGVGVMACTAVGFLLFPQQIAGLFVADPAVRSVAATLLVIAGMFQIVDGAQIIMMNALRGLSDVSVPMGIAVGSYWGVALPTSWLLAFPVGLGPQGIWIGLAAGLLAASVALTWRFWRKSSSARLASAYRAAHA